ncbi:endonuclease domain-containing protein [Sphingobium xenophagum]|uniref:endonuclease domain-containing protein n=1 Tax=Sphingobium xenophagum TaxID=121428 RepID=UPI00286D4472|nr:endonuclease domain-containing protein [Sphingobium xenophagum]
MDRVNPPRHGEGDRAAQPRGGGGVPHTRRPETYTARKLRCDLSLPEVLLWQRLRGQATGLKFRRQHPIGSYIADFYCSSLKLVIEVDGEAHNRADRPARDLHRDRFMEENGYQVLRIAASEILKDADIVAASIAALGASPLHHQPAADGPPPRAGEERA